MWFKDMHQLLSF
nr:unnamed protein product [Callosobruchus analis]